MSIRRTPMSTLAASLTAAVAITLAGAGTAAAHVTANSDKANKGGYAKVAFRVPNERDDAGTVKVAVTLPAEHPLSSVRTKPVPGWTAEIDKVTLPEPIDSHGKRLTEVARTIVWTAQPGTRIAPNEFQEFEVSLGKLPENTDELVLPTEQTYDSGEVVKWDMPTKPGAEEPERPAPTLALSAAEEGHGHGGNEAAAAGEHAHDEQAGPHDDTARWLGGAGLAVGALGFGAAIGAVLLGRRKKA